MRILHDIIYPFKGKSLNFLKVIQNLSYIVCNPDDIYQLKIKNIYYDQIQLVLVITNDLR